MKKTKSFVIILSLIMALGLCVGCTWMTTKAAPGKTRGQVNLDLGKMVLRDSSTSSSKSGLSPNDDKTAYTLHYKNKLGDMNNIGIEYYYSDKLDLTDVTRVEWSGERNYACDCKAYIYFYNSKNMNRCRVDDKDMSTSTFSAYGGDWFDVGSFGYKKYKTKSFNLAPTYNKLYLHMGMVHDWGVHKATLKIGNTSSDCINLKLKEHKVTLLDIDKIKVVTEDGMTKEVKPLSNLKIRLNDGNYYATGSAGKIYRDEPIVIQYTRSQDYDFDITGYRFYSDASKKNLLYTYYISSGKNETTINLTSSLIQSLESSLGTRNLGDFYIQPIIEQKKVTFDFQESVPGIEGVSVKKSSDGKKLVIKDEKLNQTIGEIEINNPAHIGDYFRMKYKANSSYTGKYSYRYSEIRTCDGKNNVNVTNSVNIFENSDANVVDYNQKLTKTYFWMSVHMSLEAKLVLKDKTVTYNNEYQTIDAASVQWKEGEKAPEHLNDIKYNYYTDAACTMSLSGNEKPINAGTYYVKATMAQDSLYKSAVSNVAKLVIEKAVPVIESANADEIEYGQKLSEAKNITGKVLGVTGNDISKNGKFEWSESSDKILDTGVHSENITFVITDEILKKNYTDASGTAFVKVNIQNPVVDIKDATFMYSGESIVIKDTTVKDKYTGADTGQSIYYYYYGDVDGDGVIGEYEYLPNNAPPSELGTYEVEAEVYADGGNYGTNKDRATIEIVGTPAKFLILPMKEEGKITVILTNAGEHEPEGMVSLSVGNEVIGEASPLSKGEKGYYSVQYNCYDEVIKKAGTADEIEIKAKYTPGNGEKGYVAGETNQVINVRTNYGATVKGISMDYGQVVERTIADDFNVDILEEADDITWYTMDDALKIVSEDQQKIQLEANRKVKTCIVGQVLKKGITQYIVYAVTVNKVMPQIIAYDNTFTYQAKSMSPNKVKVKVGESDYTSKINFRYEYYRDEKLQDKMKELPVNAGVYYVKVIIDETSEWGAASDSAKLTINKATPSIDIESELEIDELDRAMEIATVRGVAIFTEDNKCTYENVDTNMHYTYVADSATAKVSKGYPITIGTYRVTVTSDETDNYKSASKEAWVKVTAIVSQPRTSVRCVSSTYGSVNPTEDSVEVVDDNQQDVSEYIKDCISIRYCSTMGGEILTQRPTEAGRYYAWAVLDLGDGTEPFMSKTVEFTIAKSDVSVEISDVIEKSYDGKPIDVTSAKVIGINDGKDITEEAVIAYRYFLDAEGQNEIPAPTEPGEYYVQAVVEDMENYNGGESKLQKVMITEPEEEQFVGSFTEDEESEDSNSKENVVKTGDGEPLGLYVIFTAISLCVIVFIKKWQGGIRYEK